MILIIVNGLHFEIEIIKVVIEIDHIYYKVKVLMIDNEKEVLTSKVDRYLVDLIVKVYEP